MKELYFNRIFSFLEGMFIFSVFLFVILDYDNYIANTSDKLRHIYTFSFYLAHILIFVSFKHFYRAMFLIKVELYHDKAVLVRRVLKRKLYTIKEGKAPAVIFHKKLWGGYGEATIYLKNGKFKNLLPIKMENPNPSN